jgi:hypothetical protein
MGIEERDPAIAVRVELGTRECPPVTILPAERA